MERDLDRGGCSHKKTCSRGCWGAVQRRRRARKLKRSLHAAPGRLHAWLPQLTPCLAHACAVIYNDLSKPRNLPNSGARIPLASPATVEAWSKTVDPTLYPNREGIRLSRREQPLDLCPNVSMHNHCPSRHHTLRALRPAGTCSAVRRPVRSSVPHARAWIRCVSTRGDGSARSLDGGADRASIAVRIDAYASLAGPGPAAMTGLYNAIVHYRLFVSLLDSSTSVPSLSTA